MSRKQKKNIKIYLTFDGLTDPLGQSQIIPYLDTFITDDSDFYLVSLEKKKKINKNLLDDIKKKSNFFWEYFYFSETKNKLLKAFEILKVLFICIKISFNKNVLSIHCRGFHPSIVGIIIKYLFNTKIIFDMRGFWIDEKVDTKRINKTSIIDSFIFKILKKLESFLLKKSDFIVVLTLKVKNYLLKTKNLNEERLFVIPCSVDYKNFYIESKKFNKNELFNKLNLKNDYKIICYCGSISEYYMIDEMFHLFEKLYNKNKKYYFLLITNQKIDLNKNLYNKEYKDNIILQNSEWKNIPGLLSCADVMLSLIKPTFAKIASSPTKVAEGFALGKPLLCNTGIGDLDWIVNDNNLGYVFDINNLSKLDNIDSIIDQLLNISKDKIINQSKEIYDLKIAKQNYKKIYERIV